MTPEYTGCHALEPLMANLRALLDECDALGISDFAAAVSAQGVYDSKTDMLGFPKGVYIIPGSCSNDIAEVQGAIGRVTALLQATPGASLNVPRPDALPPDPDLIPMWVKVMAFGVLGVAALAYISPLIGLVPRRRLSGRNRRSR